MDSKNLLQQVAAMEKSVASMQSELQAAYEAQRERDHSADERLLQMQLQMQQQLMHVAAHLGVPETRGAHGAGSTSATP